MGNNSLTNLQIYCVRWNALDATMSALAENYLSRPDFPRKSTILYLLKSLQSYAAGQFHFFYYGLDPNNPGRNENDPLLEPGKAFKAPFLLDTILLQVGNDLEVIQRAADQRLVGSTQVKETLENADKLAWAAVKPAIDYGVAREATTVLTYFQKSTAIRVIPYSQVALIGIPFTCTTTPEDFLAIPHEVGHYIFRHLPDARPTIADEVRKAINEIGEPYRLWAEEIFADVYGCLIAGPIIALDFQDLSLQKSPDEFVQGDCKHPAPIVRPFIYTTVLQSNLVKKLARDNWRAIAVELEKRWTDYLREQNLSNEFGVTKYTRKKQGSNTIKTATTRPQHIPKAISLADSPIGDRNQKPLDKIINKTVRIVLERFSKYIESYKQSEFNRDLQGWAGPITEQTTVDSLYRQYKTNFKTLLSSIKLLPPEADPETVPTPIWDPDKHRAQVWINWVTQCDKGFGAHWPPAVREIKSQDDIEPGNPPPGTWRYILYANGWNTEGPCNVGPC